MSKDNKTLSVTDLLKAGTSEKELHDMLQDQIKSAKTAIAAEQEKKNERRQARINQAKTRKAAIKACYAHLVSLGIIEDNMTEKDFDEICDELEEKEDLIRTYVDNMKSFEKLFGSDEDDDESNEDNGDGKSSTSHHSNKLARGKRSSVALDPDDIIYRFLKSLE